MALLVWSLCLLHLQASINVLQNPIPVFILSIEMSRKAPSDGNKNK